MSTKTAEASTDDDLRPEYDLAALKGGVRGKYYDRATAGTTLVLLEADVAKAFPDGQTVNQALRALITVAHSQIRPLLADRTPPEGRARAPKPAKPRRKGTGGQKRARGRPPQR